MKSKISIARFRELKKIEKLRSGVFAFDLLTKGGIPIGKFTLLYGDKSTGKSSFALRIIKQFLEAYPDRNICYVDFENTFDPAWAVKIIGKDPDNLFLATPAFAEEGIEFLQEATKNNEYGLIIIDSLANIVSIQEADADAGQEFMGQIARTINKLLRRIIPYVVEADRSGMPITVILINQIRSAIHRLSYVPQVSLPGGKFQESLSSLIVRFYMDKIDKKDEIPQKVEYSFVIEKNKTGGVPKVSGKFVMDLVSGRVFNETLILQMLRDLNLIKPEKGGYIFDGEKYKTQNEIKEKLEKDEEFYRKVEKMIMEAYHGEL